MSQHRAALALLAIGLLAIGLLAFGLLLTGGAGPALAHKMKVFASVEGGEIVGYAYFSTGARVQGGGIVVTTPDGQTVFRGRADDQGQFRFAVGGRSDHRITVDGGDGHQASFTVSAGELPDSLPQPPSNGTSSAAQAPAGNAPASPAAAGACAPDQLERSLARQLRPLREQIDRWQDRIAWQDVIGGLGYLAGLGGLAFGWANRRRDASARAGTGAEP